MSGEQMHATAATPPGTAGAPSTCAATVPATDAREEALAAVSVDVADPASRERARRAVDMLGDAASGASRGRLLGRRIRRLSESGTGSEGIARSLAGLVGRLRALSPRQAHGGLPAIARWLPAPQGDAAGDRMATLRSRRREIEPVLDVLERSAETLRQNDVALGLYEREIVEEMRRVEGAVKLAGSFVPALREEIARARAAGADAQAMRFAEGEVLVPAMLHEGELRAMLAVDQQALASIALMRENDRELIRCVRQVTWAVRHALDVSELIGRMGNEVARREMEEAAGQLDEALGAADGVIPG